MKKTGILLLLAVLAVATGGYTPAAAEELSNDELTRRVTKLEQQAGFRDLAAGWLDRIAISGVLEAEAGYVSRDFNDPLASDYNESDAALATMEFGIDAEINEYVSGHVLFLWEEDDTEPVDIDEGVITLTRGDGCPGYFSAGKMYVPFGNFASSMISDPLTLEIGETRESALQLGFDIEGFYGSVYGFNGDVDEAGEDSHIDNFGANAGYAMETDDFSFDIGCGYINNILDADGLEDFVEETGGDLDKLDKYVDGVAAHAIFSTGPVMLIGEYITALDEAEFMTDAGRVEAEEIAAWNAEVACTFDLAGKEAIAAIGYQGSDNAGNLLPETRILGSIGIGIYAGTTLAFEYLHDEYENDDEADIVTAQLAVEF